MLVVVTLTITLLVVIVIIATRDLRLNVGLPCTAVVMVVASGLALHLSERVQAQETWIVDRNHAPFAALFCLGLTSIALFAEIRILRRRLLSFAWPAADSVTHFEQLCARYLRLTGWRIIQSGWFSGAVSFRTEKGVLGAELVCRPSSDHLSPTFIDRVRGHRGVIVVIGDEVALPLRLEFAAAYIKIIQYRDLERLDDIIQLDHLDVISSEDDVAIAPAWTTLKENH